MWSLYWTESPDGSVSLALSNKVGVHQETHQRPQKDKSSGVHGGE